MEKTVKNGNKSVRLNNNVAWTMEYRDQFGKDIIPTLMPMLAAALDIISGLINETQKTGDITIQDIAKLADGESLIDAMIHLGGLEFVDFVNITWALAKSSDPDIPEPREWVKQFNTFPVDIIGPVVVELVVKGVLSSKNLKRLDDLRKTIQPLRSTISSSPESNEDSQ